MCRRGLFASCYDGFFIFSFFSFSPTLFMSFRHSAELILSSAKPAANSFFFISAPLSISGRAEAVHSVYHVFNEL